MTSNDEKTATQRIADLLAERADRLGIAETQMCKNAGLSPSYLSKAKNGKLLEIPQKNLFNLASVVELTPKKLYSLLDLAEPGWLKLTSTPSRFPGEAPIRLRFPYIATVPDHLWPLLARDLFRNQNIELVPEPFSLNEFKTRMIDVEPDEADTMCVVNSEWLSDKEFKDRLRPVCLTHYYHGYSLVGRRYWDIRSLETSPTLANLFALLSELRYHNVIGEEDDGKGSIAYCDKGGWDFVRQLVCVAQNDPKSKNMLTGLNLNMARPAILASTRTFLEPLSWVGSSRFDFVVGHALTTAKAMELDEFKVFANFRHLQQLAEMLEVDDQEKSIQRDAVSELQTPVVLSMNIPLGWNDGGKIEKTCLRLCEVVNKAVESIFKSLSDGTVREMEEILATLEETRVSARHLRSAWDASFDFLTVAHAFKHADKLAPADAIMSQFLQRKGLPKSDYRTTDPGEVSKQE